MNSRFIPFESVRLIGGFWSARQGINANTTLMAIYDRFVETGRFEGLETDCERAPHIFYDSDIAKWIEAAAYTLALKRDEALEKLIDDAVDKMAALMRADGYYNMHFLRVEPENIFKKRTEHELYCAGHLLEAAIAYKRATGKAKLYDMMLKYLDLIEKAFITQRSAAFITPGHEEIELALIKLYEECGDAKYLNMARFFINERGANQEDEYPNVARAYSQSHLPVRKQFTAEGHSVRACYLYTAMADLARIDGDAELLNACQALFDNITQKRMYVTGGIGSADVGEAFTIDYDLPNLTAYSESCAAIALMWFAGRMLKIYARGVYGDVIERALYNGFLSSVSLDGKAFFYVNPIETAPALNVRDVSMGEKNRRRLPITQRREVFDCSCCPPNIARYIAAFAGDIYAMDDKALYVHQYAQSRAEWEGARITQTTQYPASGDVSLAVTGLNRPYIALRKPGWCDEWTLMVNGAPVMSAPEDGYIYIPATADMRIEAKFEMRAQLIEANPRIIDDIGKVCVRYGPIIYCAEAVDNGENVHALALRAELNAEAVYAPEYGANALMIDAYRIKPFAELYRPAAREYEKLRARLIPYFAFANRGESEMVVWMPSLTSNI